MLIQVSTDLNFTKVHRISHENAVGSKKKMVAGKSYYRYQDISCNNRIMWRRMRYVFIAYSPWLNKKVDCKQREAEVRTNLLESALIHSEFLICSPISCWEILMNCIYCTDVAFVEFVYCCIYAGSEKIFHSPICIYCISSVVS